MEENSRPAILDNDLWLEKQVISAKYDFADAPETSDGNHPNTWTETYRNQHQGEIVLQWR